MSRPTTFTQAQADEICSRMAQGQSLNQVCRADDMPARSVVKSWIKRDPVFAAQYSKARRALLDYWADEIIEIAEDGTNDWIERETAAGRVLRKLDKEHVHRSKLRIETRKWLLGKLQPRKYGDFVRNEIVSPPNTGPNVTITFPANSPGKAVAAEEEDEDDDGVTSAETA